MLEPGQDSGQSQMTRARNRKTPLDRPLVEEDLELLRAACWQLENPSLAARLSSAVGTPIDVALSLLPKHWYSRIHRVAESSIAKAYDTALLALRGRSPIPAHEGYFKGLVATSGAMGGLLGLPGLLIELPVTTTLMLRSIAEIARDHGEDMATEETRAACLAVFALGGRTEIDDAADTGYYGVRLALSSYLSFASVHATGSGLVGEGAPALVKLIQVVSAAFGRQLSARAAARALPIAGAAGAAAINVIFMQHFQRMANGHFTIRRLERAYGAEVIQAHYEDIARSF
jgi:hypothetical protein